MFHFDGIIWGPVIIGAGLSFGLFFLTYAIKHVPVVIGIVSLLICLGAIIFGIYCTFYIRQISPNLIGGPPTGPATPTIGEQAAYFQTIRCLYASCSATNCIDPFRNLFPNSSLTDSLEAAAKNAETSPSCKAPPATSQPVPPAPTPLRIPDCTANESQQAMVPTITRWVQKQVDETNALTGGTTRVVGVQLLSSRTIFGGQCMIDAIGTVAKDHSPNLRFPIDSLIINLRFDPNGRLLVQTGDGVQ